MRVTSNSMLSQYSTSLAAIGERQAKDNIRMYSGKNLIDLSDDPSIVMNIQYYDQNIERATNYLNNASSAIDEQVNSQAVLEQFSNALGTIRENATMSLQVDNGDKLPTLASNVKSLLTSMIDIANTNFNGMFSFAGTKTNSSSLTPTPPETSNLPFELVSEPPTASNPSGLRVSFKGNLDKRVVNIGPNSTEQVNATADEAFGPTGTEVFQKVIDVYNKMMYKPDGTKRNGTSTPFTVPEQQEVQSVIKGIGDSVDMVDRGTAAVGSRQTRLQSLQDQLKEEITRANDLRASVADVDMGKTILNLNKDQMSMQYALQAGSRLFSKSLMDFVS